jgi:hypothetical protein
MLEDRDLIQKKNSIKMYLSTATDFLMRMGKLLDNPNSCIVRETCRVISSKSLPQTTYNIDFVSKPDGMTCWLKFDTAKVGVDSS